MALKPRQGIELFGRGRLDVIMLDCMCVRLPVAKSVRQLGLLLLSLLRVSQRVKNCRPRVQDPRIVARGDKVSAECPSMEQELIEFDFPVTPCIRVGQSPPLQVGKKLFKNTGPILLDKINAPKPDVELHGQSLCVAGILLARAVAQLFAGVPIVHVQSEHAVAVLPKRPCCHS